MDRFVSEPIAVDIDSMDRKVLVSGSPDCPRRFLWRDTWYDVVEILQEWKHVAKEGGGASGETYVRSHRFRVRTVQGIEAVIYCDRQVSKRKKSGWWMYSVCDLEEGK